MGTEYHIPFLNLKPMHDAIEAKLHGALQDVLNGGNFILGEHLERFESAYAEYSSVRNAVGISTGLDALFLALKSLGIGPGDEVIVPAHTYIATALAVTHTGATPVFADPDPETWNISPDEINTLITDKTRAVIPVHLYGQPCEMDRIMDIAKQHGLYVVEDNAQAHGATYLSKKTGSWGHIGATSFYPAKNLGALGDGGAVTTDDDELAERVRLLRNYGSVRKYEHTEAGYNMRLDELQAAFLQVKMSHIDRWNRQRKEIAGTYVKQLGQAGPVRLPRTTPGAEHVYHLFVIRAPERDKLAEYLGKKGIGTLIHYPVPCHLQPAYRNMTLPDGSLPVSRQLAAEVLSLPIWPGMDNGMVEQVCAEIIRFYH